MFVVSGRFHSGGIVERSTIPLAAGYFHANTLLSSDVTEPRLPVELY